MFCLQQRFLPTNLVDISWDAGNELVAGGGAAEVHEAVAHVAPVKEPDNLYVYVIYIYMYIYIMYIYINKYTHHNTILPSPRAQ